MKNLLNSWLLWLYAIAIGMLFFTSSCVTQRQRERICQTCAVKDSISTRETKRDSAVLKQQPIFITQPGPVIYLPNPCAELCDSLGHANYYHQEKKENGIKTTIDVKNGVLTLRSDADSLKGVISYLEHNLIIEKEKKQTISVPVCYKEHVNWWHKTSAWGFPICLLLIITIVFILWIKHK